MEVSIVGNFVVLKAFMHRSFLCNELTIRGVYGSMEPPISIPFLAFGRKNSSKRVPRTKETHDGRHFS